MNHKNAHSADAAALGFLYQGQYALLRLWNETDDDATIYLETLDDVVLEVKGQTILEQLKHSLSEKPPSITISSVNLWKTLKAWIDVLPDLDLHKTWLHLVTVADISPNSPLRTLLSDGEQKGELVSALREEAERVISERAEATANGEKNLPHKQRAAACEAFINLPDELKAELLSRTRIKPGENNIKDIEPALAIGMTSLIENKRAQVAQLLIEWWNRQVLQALSGQRDKALRRFELVSRHMEIVRDLENDTLVDYFATEIPPNTYQSHPMLTQQVSLVGGSEAELTRSVQNEWRAREARSRWSNENPTRRELITRYDVRLAEEWLDRHTDMCAECVHAPDDDKKFNGRQLLRWSHYEAPKDLEPIAPSVASPSYIRGSYHVLSITGQIGWHPDYKAILGF